MWGFAGSADRRLVLRPKNWPHVAARLIATPGVLLAIGAMCLLGVLIGLLVEDRSMFLGLMIFSPVMVPLLTLSLITGRAVLGAGRGLGVRIRDAILSEGRCPGCGYGLKEIAAAGDGCRVCPECGAAWALPHGDHAAAEVVVVGAR